MQDLLSQVYPDMPKPEYYKLLLLNSEVIMNNILQRGKLNTANALGMSPQAFATFFPILVAYIDIQDNDTKA